MFLDTSFVIDFHLESKRRRDGDAMAFLNGHDGEFFKISMVVAAEFLEGFPADEHETGLSFLRRFEIVFPTIADVKLFAALSRHLRKTGKRIGDQDLWIACAALAEDEKLVTRNVKDFSRVSGLQVIRY